MKILSVHVKADNSRQPYVNEQRYKVILDNISNILSKTAVDVVLLPGGFFVFVSDSHLGKLKFEERKKYLEDTKFTTAIKAILEKTETILIAGIDSEEDQMCVAWNKDGILGIGRKVWTTKDEGNQYIVYFEDFGSPNRLINIKGKNVLLCSCYDAYGTEGKCDQQNTRLKNDKKIFSEGDVIPDSNAKQRAKIREKGQEKWNELLSKADIAVTAIHYLAKRGKGSGKGYWVRAIRKRSKHIAIFGAANFEEMNMNEKNEKNLFAAKNGAEISLQSAIEINDEKEQVAIARFYSID